MTTTGRRRPANPKSCHERALGLLAVRPRSRRELERRLLAAGFPGEEVADVLERLERVGLIDDEAFARAVAEHAFQNRRSGARAVREALASKGVAASTAAAVIEELGEGEEDRALELARTKALRMGSVPTQVAFSRLVGMLARRGYPAATARRAARIALRVDGAEE